MGETYLQVGQIDLFLSDVLTGEGSDEIVYFDSTHVSMGRWRCVGVMRGRGEEYESESTGYGGKGGWVDESCMWWNISMSSGIPRQFGIWSPPGDRTRNWFFVYLVYPRNCYRRRGVVVVVVVDPDETRWENAVWERLCCLERLNHPFVGLCGPAVRRSHVFREGGTCAQRMISYFPKWAYRKRALHAD